MSHDGEDYTQIAFLRSDIDDSTGEYTERFEAGSFDMPAADALRFDLAVDLMDYFSGRTFEGEPGVSRGLEPREAVAAVEGATGCDLNFFEDFWLGSPGEIVESVHVGPYTKQSLLDFSYYAKELSRRYGFADSDILEIARHLPEECPDRFAAVKAYLDCEYVPDGDAPDEKTYRWGDFLEIAGGDARYAAMLVDRTAAGESEEGLHPETLAFDGNPAAARPLHVSPATISQAVRYGTPVAGLHFYHGDEPKPAPEFFKPIKPERGKSPMQMAAAARAAAGNPGRPDGGQRPRRAV